MKTYLHSKPFKEGLTATSTWYGLETGDHTEDVSTPHLGERFGSQDCGLR